MDDENQPLAEKPATRRFQQLDPALLDKVREDPDASRPYYRTISMITDHELYQLRNQLPVPQRLALADRWAKLAGMEPKKQEVQHAQGQGYQLVINIGSTAESFKGVTVEQKPTPELPDASI